MPAARVGAKRFLIKRLQCQRGRARCYSPCDRRCHETHRQGRSGAAEQVRRPMPPRLQVQPTSHPPAAYVVG
jgi:hypothetical protein